ncbi:MAG: AMP-binding protein [Candidatus Bathyarchaeia archaeon]
MTYYRKPWFKLWPKNVPTLLNYPEITLSQVLENAASEYPNKPAIIFEDKALTYEKLNDNVKRFASALHDLGIKKGDRVAIFSLNCPQSS